MSKLSTTKDKIGSYSLSLSNTHEFAPRSGFTVLRAEFIMGVDEIKSRKVNKESSAEPEPKGSDSL